MKSKKIVDYVCEWMEVDKKNRGGLILLAENEGEDKINLSLAAGHNSRLIANGLLHLMEKNKDFASVALYVVNKYKEAHPFCEIEIP